MADVLLELQELTDQVVAPLLVEHRLHGCASAEGYRGFAGGSGSWLARLVEKRIRSDPRLESGGVPRRSEPGSTVRADVRRATGVGLLLAAIISSSAPPPGLP